MPKKVYTCSKDTVSRIKIRFEKCCVKNIRFVTQTLRPWIWESARKFSGDYRLQRDWQNKFDEKVYSYFRQELVKYDWYRKDEGFLQLGEVEGKCDIKKNDTERKPLGKNKKHILLFSLINIVRHNKHVNVCNCYS